MSLEEQISRMGDARASQVTTVDWRAAAGGRGKGRLVLVGAAAIAIVVVAVVATVRLSTSDDDLDVTGDEAGELERWLPAGGVASVHYPGDAAALPFFFGLGDVALVAPPVGSADEADTTRIQVWTPWGRPPTQPATDYRVADVGGGLVELNLRRDEDWTLASIETRRFSADEMASRAEELLPLGNDVAALARAIASWDDGIDVRYVGPVSTFVATVNGATEDETVLWFGTPSDDRFIATFDLPPHDAQQIGEWFALDSAQQLVFSQRYLGFDPQNPPVRASEDEWLEILRGLIGDEPIVTVDGSEQFAMEGFLPPLADTPVAATRSGQHWTVALRFAEPTAIRDGGGFTARIGDTIEVTFGFAEPGVEFTSLPAATAMTEAEARLIAETMNAHLDGNPPTTSAPPTYPTVEVDACSVTVPDDATPISADRTPLDVDQDGAPDEFLVSEGDNGPRIHVVTADATLWVDVPGGDRPRLLDRPEGGAAGRDLDGDGLLEFFLAPLSTNGAELALVAECGGTVHEIGQPEGEWCIRDGGFHCDRRIVCVGDAVISDMTSGGDVDGLDEGQWRWGRTETRIVDGEIVAVGLASIEYELANPPPGVPTPGTTGTVDCSPDRDAALATIASTPTCAGTGDRPADAALVEEIDLDQDGVPDRIISWDDDGGTPGGRLLVELAHGVTPSIEIPYNFGGPDFLAATDVDGDGVLEIFLLGPSNTAYNAFAVQLVGCTIHVVDYGDEPSLDPWAQGYLLHGIGGGSCDPTGCEARVTCTAPGIMTEQTGPNDHRNEQFDPDDPEMYWWRTVYELDDGAWWPIESTTTSYGHADPPADSPQVLGSGLYC